MRFINYIFLLNLFFVSGTVFGQRKVEEYFPRTPEAASLAKIIDIPAGSYSGTANFTIPLFDIDFDGQKVPFNIVYNTSGIKVAEIASRVGLGWAINLGDVSLSAQIMGIKDYNSRFTIPINFNPNVPGSSDQILAMDITAVGSEVVPPQDVQPDIYTYSTFTNNGEFIFDSHNNTGIPMPYNQNKISRGTNGLGVNILDEKGFKYNFIENGIIYNYTTCSPPSLLNRSGYNLKIKEIESPSGKKMTYIYDYTSAYVNAKYITSVVQNKQIEDLYFGPQDSIARFATPLPNKCYTYTDQNENTLKKISFPDGEIELYYNDLTSEPREDLPDEYYIKRIVLRDLYNNIIKDFSFNYEYFVSDETIVVPTISWGANGTKKRLKLISLIDNKQNAKYQFKYYGEAENLKLPNRLSNSYDYWGVYNGKENETSIATTIYKKSRYDSGSDSKRLFVGADKQPDFNYGVIGNLKEIIYPTGGSTKITYEADDFVRESYSDPIYSYEEEFSDYLVTNSGAQNGSIDFTIEGKAYEFLLYFFSEDRPQTQFPPAAHIGDCTLKIYKYPDLANPVKSMSTYLPQDQYNNYYDTFTSGTYKMVATPGVDLNNGSYQCMAYATWYHQILVDDSPVRKAGTLRIKRVEQTDNNQSKVIRDYTYYQEDVQGNRITSGLNIGDQYFTSIASSIFPLNNIGRYVERTYLTSNPGWNLSSVGGKSIGYTDVQEKYTGTQSANSYSKTYHFLNNNEVDYNLTPYSFLSRSYPQKDFTRGFLLNEKEYKQSTLVRSTDYEEPQKDPYFNYLSTTSPSSNLLMWGLEIYNTKIDCSALNCFYTFLYEVFNINNYWLKNIKTTTTEYFPSGNIVTESLTDYSSNPPKHTFPISNSTTNSLGQVEKTEYQYAPDLVGSEPLMSELVAKNQIGTPVLTKTFNGSTQTSEQKTVYAQDATTNNLILPKYVYAKKGSGLTTSDKKITYVNYSDNGNLTEYQMENGISVAIIWGYNKQYPIAKIEGATYAQVASYAGNLQTLSNGGTLVEDSFNSLRDGLPNAMITSYLYKPLVGVTKITPPNRQSITYQYDTAGRLEKVVDQNGHTVSENSYHYKP